MSITRTVVSGKWKRRATSLAAALSQASPTISSNRLLNGALDGSCSIFSTRAPHSGHRKRCTSTTTVARYLERWDQRRRKPALKQMGVDEIYRGKNDKFLTVVSNLETGEPLWFGKERKKETLDEYFRTQLRSGQRKRIEAACVDMWEPFRLSIEEWAPACRIVY